MNPIVPRVSNYKYMTNGKHLTHICERWATDRTDGLQYAFFNGAGYESWENIWGIWNQFTPRDGEALRRISKLLRHFGDHLQGMLSIIDFLKLRSICIIKFSFWTSQYIKEQFQFI